MAHPSPIRADTIAGGGLRRSDCLSVFTTPAGADLRGRRLICTDGDPSCDSDGVVDGVCSMAVGVCLNAAGMERCTSPGVAWVSVAHADDDGDRLFDPDFQALQARIDAKSDFPERETNVCTAPSLFRVSVDGPLRSGSCRTGRKTIRLDARSVFTEGHWVRDRDRLQLVCRPAPEGCDATLFFASTFNRIQEQVFDQRCATGGCHDSESTAGGLLLEQGASYTSLVGAIPNNGSAAAAQLLRVAPADPDRSLLLQKLSGELPSEFGARMPSGERRLPVYLRDLISDWIRDGAPATGWVPGTGSTRHAN
ncbi:MAG: hypothetical protein ABGY42_05700 [bacterium]